MRDRPTPVNRSIWTCRRSNDLIYAANLQMSRATGTVPERVQSRVHTTEPTGPVPEPFHCDHIARWSARSGTTGRSGTGLNTGDWNGSGTVPVPNLWCEHGHRDCTCTGNLNGVENVDPIFSIKKIKTGKITRVHNFTLVKMQSRLDVRKYSCSQMT